METSAQATPATAKPLAITFTIPTLAPGERYAGLIIDDSTGQPTHHLILLPGDEAHTWHDGIEWAKAQGGELPTRQELSLLYTNLKSAFQKTWYWSSEQGAGHAAYAWGQGFDDGYQGLSLKGYQGRVRAVRRFLID